MRLEHYRKLYEAELRKELSTQPLSILSSMLIDRYSIKDWKAFEQHLREQEEERESS